MNMLSFYRKYHTTHKDKFPSCLFVFRGGVSDGELSSVYETEMKKVEDVLAQHCPLTALCFIVVRVLYVLHWPFRTGWLHLESSIQ